MSVITFFFFFLHITSLIVAPTSIRFQFNSGGAINIHKDICFGQYQIFINGRYGPTDESVGRITFSFWIQGIRTLVSNDLT